MKPVFVSDQVGCLYQTGYRQLEKMAPERFHFLVRDLGLVLAVSDRVHDRFPFQFTFPFGDNKQWHGPPDDLRGMILAAASQLQRGNNVLVYCYYGVNRSGLVAALIIRDLLGCTGAEALARLRMARRGAVGGNAHFVSYLEELPAP